jgi:antitoxin VapB
MSATISRVFMSGNSQAVRIPQAFRLDTSRVEIFQTADGDLVLHPVPADRVNALVTNNTREFKRLAGLALGLQPLRA